jgi:hypothetical protein
VIVERSSLKVREAMVRGGTVRIPIRAVARIPRVAGAPINVVIVIPGKAVGIEGLPVRNKEGGLSGCMDCLKKL